MSWDEKLGERVTLRATFRQSSIGRNVTPPGNRNVRIERLIW